MSQGGLSDDRLARAAAHGEPDAFGEIFARHNGALYGYCLSILGDPEDARDALQATMEKAFAAISTQRVRGGLRAWLFGIAHNEAVSLGRKRQATQPYGESLALAAAATDPAERERMGELVADLGTLPDQQRSALVLRELAGLGSEEIGSALDISPAAAKQAVYEARASLLAQRGGRDMDCHQVQMKLSESDGRIRRGRRLKAHLADCALCSAFAAAIPARTAGMRAVFPPLGAALAAKTLAAATAGGGAAGGSAGAAAAAGEGSKATMAGAGAAVTAVAVLVIALSLGSAESDPTSVTPPAKAAPAPAKPRPAAPARPKPAAPAAEPSSAQRPAAAVTGYSDLGPGVLGTLEGPGATATAAPAGPGARSAEGGGSLPFTGLDLALLALGGVTLLGTGAALRRISRAPRL